MASRERRTNLCYRLTNKNVNFRPYKNPSFRNVCSLRNMGVEDLSLAAAARHWPRLNTAHCYNGWARLIFATLHESDFWTVSVSCARKRDIASNAANHMQALRCHSVCVQLGLVILIPNTEQSHVRGNTGFDIPADANLDAEANS